MTEPGHLPATILASLLGAAEGSPSQRSSSRMHLTICGSMLMLRDRSQDLDIGNDIAGRSMTARGSA